MASIRDTKQRIKSVTSTQQITKAMNLVAASKLGKAKATLLDAKPFFRETKRVIANIIKNANSNNIYLKKQEGEGKAVIVVTADRGLCGGYNSNICKEADKLIKTIDDEKLILVGSKGRDYYRARGRNIIKVYTGISEKPLYNDANEIGHLVLDMYTKGEVSEVYIAYTEFVNTISHTPTLMKILPLDTEFLEVDKSEIFDMIYEPSEEFLLDYIVPKFVNTSIYAGLVESSACEQGARMTSMDNATKNGKEMIEQLTVVYNRARQGAITQEITEIVGGVNALS